MDSVFWLLPARLAGRPGPTKSPWDLGELSEFIDVVLNLSEHPCPTEELDALQLQHLWVPLPTAVPPDAEAERRCVQLLPNAQEYVRERLNCGHRVLVHCVSGKDRTGMLLAYHLAREHVLSANQALDRVRRVRPEALSAPGWEEMALRVIHQLLAAA